MAKIAQVDLFQYDKLQDVTIYHLQNNIQGKFIIVLYMQFISNVQVFKGTGSTKDSLRICSLFFTTYILSAFNSTCERDFKWRDISDLLSRFFETTISQDDVGLDSVLIVLLQLYEGMNLMIFCHKTHFYG